MFRFRSVSNIVMAPANTGSLKSSRIAVKNTAHTNSGIRSIVIPVDRILITVVMKLTAPKMDDTPARWSEKMQRSTDAPAWAIPADRGGYTVHPVPTPLSTSPLDSSNVSDGGSSQNLMLFIRGNAISGAPNISGTSQFPNPPIMIGITMKKIITKACAVTITL